MGVTLKEASVHIGPGVTLVGIDQDVLDGVGGVTGPFPLGTSREATAATATEVGFFNLLEDFFRGHLRNALGQGSVTANGQIVFDAFGIDAPVGAEDQPV